MFIIFFPIRKCSFCLSCFPRPGLPCLSTELAFKGLSRAALLQWPVVHFQQVRNLLGY